MSTKVAGSLSCAVLIAFLPRLAAAGQAAQQNGGVASVYSVGVRAECTLRLPFASAVPFAPRNAGVTTDCSIGNAQLNFYDGALTGSQSFLLVSGSHSIAFSICQGSANGDECYLNSDDPARGVTIGSGVQTTNLRGRLPAQAVHAPGAYTDVVTVSLTFS